MEHSWMPNVFLMIPVHVLNIATYIPIYNFYKFDLYPTRLAHD